MQCVLAACRDFCITLVKGAVPIAFDAGSIEATLTLNRNPFTAGLAAARAQARNFRVEVPLDVKLNQASLVRARQEIQRILGKAVRIDVELNQASLTRVRQQIESIRPKAKLELDLDRSSLARVRAQLAAQRFTIRVDIDGGGAGSLGSSFSGAASHFQRMATLIIGTAPVISSAIIGIVGAAGALGGALGVAAAGAGVFALVAGSMFSKINKATQDSTTAMKNNASAAKAVANARQALVRAQENAAEATVRSNRRIEDAERAVARARDAAGEAAASAARRVADAERSLEVAQEGALRAQEDLNEARRDAVEELEDLQLALRGGALSEEQAVLNLEKAQLRYNEALREGVGGNEIKQLELDTRQAALAVDEARERYGDLKLESAEWAKTGIEGSEGVRNAQDRLRDANRGVEDAERNVDEARQDAARVALENSQNIADAQRNLDEARADAARQERENQRNIADAVEDLRMAQESANASAVAGMVALTKAEQMAADALRGLKADYEWLKKETESGVAKAMVANFEAWGVALRTLVGPINAASRGFETIGRLQQQYFAGDDWERFTRFLSENTEPVLVKLFLVLAYAAQGVMNLIIAFKPLTDWMLDALVKGMQSFAEWTEKLGSNPRFLDFIDRVKQALPAVIEFLGQLILFIWNVVVGLEPLGTIILRVLTQIFEALNKLPPEWLAAIALGIAAIWAAMALGAGGPVAIAIGVLAGLAVVLANLYEKNEAFRTSVNDLAEDVKSYFLPMWEKVKENFDTKIKPAWDEMVRIIRDELIPKLREFGEEVAKQMEGPLGDLVDTITGKVIPSILEFIGMLAKVIGFLVDTFGPTIADELAGMVRVFDGSFQMIAGLLDVFTGIFTGDWQKFTEGIKGITLGFWTIIAGMFGMSLEELKALVQRWDADISNIWRDFWGGIESFFRQVWATIRDIWNGAFAFLRGDTEQAAMLIGRAWERIANLFREPINWVIRTVINPPTGLLGAWNAVMGWIGATGLGNVRVPEIPVFGGTFARGGVLPGYAPRQDSLLAAVSPGEAVMVPEWTKMMGGPKAIRKMNDAAMNGMYYEGNPRMYSRGGMIPHFAYGGVAPHVAFAGDEVVRNVGSMPGGIGGVGARANASDHPTGHALDFMTMTNVGLGNRVAAYLTAHWNRLQVKYLIWLQRIASSPGAWRGMADRGSRTANHMDHVHASFTGGGGGGGALAPVLVSWWSIIADKVKSLFGGIFNGDIPGLSGAIGEAVERIPKALIDKVIGKVQEKLSAMMTAIGTTPALDAAGGSNTSLGFGTADRGALIPPGRSTLFNATGRAEPLVNYDLYKKMNPGVTVEDVLAILREWQGSGSGSGDTYNVMLPDKATVRELANQLDFKRRVVSKGRYGR